MADPRFYTVAGPFAVEEIAAIADAEIRGEAAPGRTFRDVAPLDTAGADDLSFLDNRAYLDRFAASSAGACLVAPDLADFAPESMILLVTDAPYRAYARVARAFYPDEFAGGAEGATGAHVDPTARLGADVVVAPGAVVGPGVELGPRCRVGPNAVIGHGVRLGEDCRVGAGASVRYCLAGNRVVVFAGARIGEDGFGYASDASGHLRIPQLGRVLLGDDVEIGANATIDRGAGPDTVVGDGCIIDNLVQIGHNVRLGKRCIIVAQVGISGSTVLGDNVVIGGQSGIAGHLSIGDGARIGAQSGVIADVPEGVTLLGSPARPKQQFWREVAALKRLVAERGK